MDKTSASLGDIDSIEMPLIAQSLSHLKTFDCFFLLTNHTTIHKTCAMNSIFETYPEETEMDPEIMTCF